MERDLANGQGIRSFIAIELERDVLRAIEGVQAALKKQVHAGAVRWVNSSGIHLTLKFLGNVPASLLPEVIAGLERAVAPFAAFGLTCGELGCFPNVSRPRVVWIGVQEPTGVLAAVQRAVEKEISPLGYPTEERGFTPHLTLGRAGREARPDELRLLGQIVAARSADRLAAMEVREISLMRSDLRSTGAVYTCLRAAPLAARR